MKRKPRPGKATTRLNGAALRYALSDWQLDEVLFEHMATGRPEAEIANELADRFFGADLVADRVIELVRQHSTDALQLLQDMLDRGAVDALALASIVNEAATLAGSQSQRERVSKRYAKRESARKWVLEQWACRKAGQFATRDDFVAWCFAHCPAPIEADHDRVRDTWVPRGRAADRGPLAH